MWIDSHAHLFDSSDNELSLIVDEATGTGVDAIVSTATDIINARQVIHHCENYSQLWGAVGISPFDVTDLPATWFDDLCSLLDHPKIIAVGETGIDATNPRYPPLSLQRPVFEQQLIAARDRQLPIIIHSRGAEKETAGLCRANGIVFAMFHCFTGDHRSLRAILDNGYYVSLSGIVTFPRSELRDLIRNIPIERLLIETDSPYLAPVPHRGKKNRPALVRFVGEEIARLLGKPSGQIGRQIQENFARLFQKYRPAAEPSPH
ncbi:MAG: TatD family hydrolase [Chitinispirillaceae bacterium]|nr:TatD family hydrolase [Chitinispirillaceae bacterium]